MNSEKWMTGQGFVFSFVGPIENSNPDFQDLVFSYVYMLKYESFGEGIGYPLQYSCLENPKKRRAWRATVHRVAKSWTRLKRLSTA